MATTYNDDPKSDGSVAQRRDAVRFLARDNVSGQMAVSDAEIAFCLSEEANVYRAAARIARMKASKGVTRKKTGDLELAYDPAEWSKLADELERRGSGHQVPYVGGASQADKEIDRQDSDAAQPAFYRGLHEEAPTSPNFVTGSNE